MMKNNQKGSIALILLVIVVLGAIVGAGVLVSTGYNAYKARMSDTSSASDSSS